jgi:cell wall-associated NlpC family hydrolase
MPRYSAEQIYGFARRAGFSPDEATTMTAIALAESGGNSMSHNPHGEDSRGLWQINALAHPGLAQKYNLYDPLQNALAAHQVSRGGADVSPWTVTHGGPSARYLRYRDQAEAAAVAQGDGRGHGVWTGTPGYGHPLAAGHDGGGGPPAPAADIRPAAPEAPAGNPARDRFLDVARAQIGDRYVFGAEVELDDPNPTTFDCSELTQWAAHQAGVTIPDGATAQFRFLRARGLVVPVEQAKHTPGALLFNFNSNPGPTGGEDPGAHVAISTGDGRTIEAMNPSAGVRAAEAGNRFKYAAVIPGISDGATVAVPAPVPVPPVEPAAAPLPAPGGPDSDHDGLTDEMERRLGLDPLNADTDGDNLPDALELVTTHTDPHQADTDGDRLNDAFELARGLDPTSPDSDADGHLDGSFATNQVDSDLDGLDDDLERALALDPAKADTDADGFSDALEVRGHSDPLDAHSTPLNRPADALHLDSPHTAALH